MTITRPHDPDGMNERRAEFAAKCIALMSEITGCEDGEEAARDLLCDFFHWCDRKGLDMELMIRGARSNYRAETGED